VLTNITQCYLAATHTFNPQWIEWHEPYLPLLSAAVGRQRTLVGSLLISHSAEGRRLSWSGWLITCLRRYTRVLTAGSPLSNFDDAPNDITTMPRRRPYTSIV